MDSASFWNVLTDRLPFGLLRSDAVQTCIRTLRQMAKYSFPHLTYVEAQAMWEMSC